MVTSQKKSFYLGQKLPLRTSIQIHVFVLISISINFPELFGTENSNKCPIIKFSFSEKATKDFANFCGLLREAELYKEGLINLFIIR